MPYSGKGIEQGCQEALSESFHLAQDERREFEILDDFSVHAYALEVFVVFQQPDRDHRIGKE